MLKGVKKYFLKKFISENKIDRTVQLTSLQHAKSIGIICEISNEDSYKDIFSLFTKLQQPGRSVWLVGFINDAAVPFFCLQQLAADYFCKKDLNWYGKPNKVQINDFVDRNFDILLDFNVNSFPANDYILSLSKAKFIVGAAIQNKHFYDLFIDTAATDNYQLLEMIHFYTKKLNGE